MIKPLFAGEGAYRGGLSEMNPLDEKGSDLRENIEISQSPDNVINSPRSETAPSMSDLVSTKSVPVKTPESAILPEKHDIDETSSLRIKATPIQSLELNNLVKQTEDNDDEARTLVPLTSKRDTFHNGVYNRGNTATGITDGLPEKRVAAPTPPAVKVTIGRIEVRAVMQQTPLRPPQRNIPSKPRVSLDDYLKNHRGGRR